MSGLADPVPVIQILLTDHHVTAVFELRTVIRVADGVHGVGHLARHPESVKQAAVADTIVISKTDLADSATLETLAARLAAINPGARQLRVAHGDVDPEQILDQPGFDVVGAQRRRARLAQRSVLCRDHGAGVGRPGDLHFRA